MKIIMDDKKKTRACTECHRSKNKCTYAQTLHGENQRCERCVRLDKECIPHLSRQGKRKHRLTGDNSNASSVSSSSPARAVPVVASGGINRHVAPRSSATVATGSLSNQAQIIDMVENSNLQQLSNSLNLNMYHGNNSTFSQQLHQNPNIASQRRNSTERVAETMLLSRAMGDSISGTTNVMGVGSGNVSIPPSQLDVMSQAGFLSNLDPAKLNMMISHLTNNVSSSNGTGNNNSNANNVSNQAGASNYNLGSSTSDMGSQPSAAALLMLAGTSGNIGRDGTSSSGNGTQSNNFNSMNTFNANSNINNGVSSNMMGYNNVGGVMGTPIGRSSSIGHAPPAPSSVSIQETGRRSSMPLGIGRGNNVGTDASQQGGGNNVYSNNMGGTSDSLLKKQKTSHILPVNAGNSQGEQLQSRNMNNGNPPAHVPYPPISLLPTQKTTNSNNSSAVKSNNGWSDVNRQRSTTSSQEASLSRSTSMNNFQTPEDAIGNHIARACAKNSGQKLTSLKNHYGLQCQIREWISMALIRRSFALLGKASSLANRCGIHMDRILCGVSDEVEDTTEVGIGNASFQRSMGSRMNYLLASLLEPRAHQTIPVHERHMLVPHLPKEFLSVVGCQACPTFQESDMRNRWIIIRQTHHGVTRFYCSPAFERNVLCWTHISQIYEENLADINSLIFVKDDFRKFLACNAHQVSLHSTEGMPPSPIHAPKLKIRLLGRQWGQTKYGNPPSGKITKEMIRQVQEGNAMTLEMDLRFVSFPTMDKTTYFLEFFHHSKDGNSTTGTAASWTRNLSDISLNKAGDAAQQSASFSNTEKTDTERMVSQSPGNEAPPSFDDVIDSEEWVGINDVLASGDIDDLLTALLD
ncbi:hypothetical protein ACHAXR_010406 [Thalassiosira sp. AJA248-18]